MTNVGYPDVVQADTRARFWAKVAIGPDTTCWPWRASRHPNGYGQFSVSARGKRTNMHAHRVAFMLTYGPIPNGLQINHTCDVRACCNPDHLYIGTHGDNMRDAVHSGTKPDVILDWPRVEEIRRRRGLASAATIGREFGVDGATIQDIWHARTWKAPRTSFCWWCKRAIRFEDADARRVLTAEGEEWVCGRCWEQNAPPLPVTYEEEGPDAAGE